MRQEKQGGCELTSVGPFLSISRVINLSQAVSTVGFKRQRLEKRRWQCASWTGRNMRLLKTQSSGSCILPREAKKQAAPRGAPAAPTVSTRAQPRHLVPICHQDATSPLFPGLIPSKPISYFSFYLNVAPQRRG